MIRIRPSNARGAADHGWLQARHSFSFAEYHDPAYDGYSVLRVINDDVIGPERGFGLHPHRDMEIVTYVLEGSLRHEDSMGHGAVIQSGDVQYMSAGTGIRHSEHNASATDPLHLLQIWILPSQSALTPQYDQKTIAPEKKHGRWCTIASNDGRDDSLTVQQDILLLAAIVDGKAQLDYQPASGRRVYVQLARGKLMLNGNQLNAGDGVFIEQESDLSFTDGHDAEVLLFDLP